MPATKTAAEATTAAADVAAAEVAAAAVAEVAAAAVAEVAAAAEVAGGFLRDSALTVPLQQQQQQQENQAFKRGQETERFLSALQPPKILLSCTPWVYCMERPMGAPLGAPSGAPPPGAALQRQQQQQQHKPKKKQERCLLQGPLSSSSSSSNSSSSRVYWGGIDGAKGRCKVRRSCLGFTADGGRVLAGLQDALVAAPAATLSVHLNIPAAGVGLVLPHPQHPDLVALGSQGPNRSGSILRILDLRQQPPRSFLSSSSSEIGVAGCTYTSPYGEEWWTGAWHPSGKYLVCIDKRDRLHCLEPQQQQQQRGEINGSPSRSSSSSSSSSSNSGDSIGGFKSRVRQLEAVTYGCCFGLGGDVLIAAQEEGCCRVFPSAVSLAAADANSLLLPVLQGSAVAAAAAGLEGERFAVGGADGSIQILETKSLSSVASFLKTEGPLQSLSLSSSGKLLAWAEKKSSSVDKEEPLLRRLEEGPKLSDYKLSVAAVSPAEVLLQLHTPAPVTATAFHPYRDILVFACDVDSNSSSSSSSRYSSSSNNKNLAILTLE
ncbi:hypothetical protein Emed_003458 [Eimeria media]